MTFAQVRLQRLRLVVLVAAKGAGEKTTASSPDPRDGAKAIAVCLSRTRRLYVVLVRDERPPLGLDLLLQRAIVRGERTHRRVRLLRRSLLASHAVIQLNIYFREDLL